MRKNKKGFTLIEIIVVVTVMGILLGIMVPGVANYISDAKAKECDTNRKTLLLELDAKRVLNPEKNMGDIIAEHDEIKCPEGGEYHAVGKNGVECTIHGADSLFSGNGKESFEDVAGLETNVVTEEADGSEPITPPGPTEPDVRPNPDNVVADGGDLKLQMWHKDEELPQVTIDKGNVYRVEQKDGSILLYVGVSKGNWAGADWEGESQNSKNEIKKINFDNIFELNDFGPVDDKGKLVCNKTIEPGTIIQDKNTGKYYVCNATSLYSGTPTNLKEKSHWTELQLK